MSVKGQLFVPSDGYCYVKPEVLPTLIVLGVQNKDKNDTQTRYLKSRSTVKAWYYRVRWYTIL